MDIYTKHTTSSALRAASPEHRRSKRRRFVRKLHLLLLILGAISLAIAGLMAAVAMTREGMARETTWMLALAYLGGGVFCLAVRGLMTFVQSWSRRHGRARTAIHLAGNEQGDTPADRSGQEGMVLILVLVLLAVVAALIMHAQWAALAAHRLEATVLQQARLGQALTDAAFHVLQSLAREDDQAVDHLGEEWTRYREWETPDGIAIITQVFDEQRFFDLNNLSIEGDLAAVDRSQRIIMDVMTLSGDFTPVQRMEALRDWIDRDDEGIREASFYLEREPPYRPPNDRLRTWGELPWIEGFSLTYFEPRMRQRALQREFEANIIDQITVLPMLRTRPVPVNINTASREVLLGVLGFERDHLVRYILAARDTDPFYSIEGLLSTADPNALRDVRPFIDVRSSFFRIEARAYQAGASRQLWALAHRDTTGYIRIIQWVI